MWCIRSVYPVVAIVLTLGARDHVQAQCEPADTTKLTATDGAAGDLFGHSVSISGNVAIVGADRDDDLGNRSGSAHVFRYDGDAWAQEAKLTAADGAESDWFGWAVSTNGDVAIVGAHGDDDHGPASGSVYIFRYAGGVWAQEAKLTASDGEQLDRFGSAVSMGGDVAVVGAHNDDNDTGSVYVFRHDGGAWGQEAKLTASDGVSGDAFGVCVSMSDDRAVVGVPSDDNGTGSAYVFRHAGGVWVQEAKLTASDGEAFDRFGNSVSLSGATVFVGAHRSDDHGNESGSAYVFRLDAGGWGEEQKLIPADSAAEDRFGASVSASGDVLLVGAFNVLTLDRPGSAYVFRHDGRDWVQAAKLTGADDAEIRHFGYAVSMGGDVAMVGAYTDDDNGTDAGAAYVFELAHCLCHADLDGSGDAGFADLLLVLSSWGPCVGCPEDLDGNHAVGFGDLLIVLSSWGPCPPPRACCLPDGTCDVLTYAACVDAGGAFQGDSPACSEATCPPGGCCLPTNECTIATWAECQAAGGVHLGDDTTCAAVDCSEGACCLDGFGCLNTDPVACDQLGGVFQGVGTTCASASCP